MNRPMPSADRAHGPHSISQCDDAYPGCLVQRLGADAPHVITIVGSPAPLSAPVTAFLCSKEAPGATILKAFDQAAAWRDSLRCVISGFHSPLERQCLDILLRGQQSVVMALARGFGALRLPAKQRRAIDDGRLTIISPFASTERRATADLAHRRNLFIAALADDVVFGFVAPGGSLARLQDEIRRWDAKTHQLHGERGDAE